MLDRPLLGALHQEACIPTEHAKPLYDILNELTTSDMANLEATACTMVQEAYQRMSWKNPWKSPKGVRAWSIVEPHKFQDKSLHELMECRRQLIAHHRGGLLLHLRLITEVAAVCSMGSKFGLISGRVRSYLENLDGIALVDTLDHYKALSSDDLWFLMRRSAADARDRKFISPGRYLPRWRRLITDICRTRNCEIRVRLALQSSPLPVELQDQILRSLLKLECLPFEINWEKVWSNAKDKPKKPKSYIPELDVALPEEILPEYKLDDGEVVFDPIARQFAWVLKRFGGAVYFGYEPTLLYDSFLGRWEPNEKQRAKFGRLLGLKDT